MCHTIWSMCDSVTRPRCDILRQLTSSAMYTARSTISSINRRALRLDMKGTAELTENRNEWRWFAASSQSIVHTAAVFSNSAQPLQVFFLWHLPRLALLLQVASFFGLTNVFFVVGGALQALHPAALNMALGYWPRKQRRTLEKMHTSTRKCSGSPKTHCICRREAQFHVQYCR